MTTELDAIALAILEDHRYVPPVEIIDRHRIRLTLEDGTKREVSLRGHWLYVRQRAHQQTYQGTIILRPTSGQEASPLCDVLAIGPMVGQRRSPNEARSHHRRDVTPHLNNPIRLGDVVAVPNHVTGHPWGVKQSPYCFCDAFIDEDVVEAIVEEVGT